MNLLVGQAAAQRLEGFGDPRDRTALTQREPATPQRIRVEREAQHGALSSFGVDDGSDETPSGSRLVAAVSGWAATSSDRWFGKYRYAVVREMPALSATSSTVAV